METYHYNAFNWLMPGLPDPVPASTALMLNLVFRLLLCPLALLVLWVPMTLLWKNGELPAYVLVASNWLTVIFTFFNAVIWPSQAFARWWDGQGWCDVQAYLQFSLATVYSTSICAVMRRLSKQVGLTRVAGPSAQEKRRRLLVQALLIFPVPLLQIVLTVFVQGQRYSIMPVNGCGRMYYGSVIYLVFFVLPSPLFTVAACFHAFQTYRKFREVEASTRVALREGSNSVAHARSQRARRKLYWMVLCILVPYAPLEICFLAYNILMGWPWKTPFDFHSVHFAAAVVPWDSVTFKRYSDTGFVEMNTAWISVVTAFVIFAFFGTSKDGINIYRTYLVRLGLARFFPRLREPYDPDRRSPGASALSSARTQLSTQNTSIWSRKGSIIPMYQSHSQPSERRSYSDLHTAEPPVTEPSMYQRALRRFHGARHHVAAAPVEELELERHAAPVAGHSASSPRPAAAVLFRPGFNWTTPPKLPSLPVPSFLKGSPRHVELAAATAVPETLGSSVHVQQHHGNTPPASYDSHLGSLPPFPTSTTGGYSAASIGAATTTATMGTAMAVKTQVWSEGQQSSHTAKTAGEAAGHRHGQGGVRVGRSITSHVQ